MFVCKVTACSTRRPPDVRGVRTIASCPGTPSSAPAGVERVSIPSRGAPHLGSAACESYPGKWLEDFPGAIPSRGDYGVQKEMTLAASDGGTRGDRGRGVSAGDGGGGGGRRRP